MGAAFKTGQSVYYVGANDAFYGKGAVITYNWNNDTYDVEFFPGQGLVKSNLTKAVGADLMASQEWRGRQEWREAQDRKTTQLTERVNELEQATEGIVRCLEGITQILERGQS